MEVLSNYGTKCCYRSHRGTSIFLESDIQPVISLEKLGLDSLKASAILNALEDLLKIEIPNEAIEQITTVGDIVTKVDELLASQT